MANESENLVSAVSQGPRYMAVHSSMERYWLRTVTLIGPETGAAASCSCRN